MAGDINRVTLVGRLTRDPERHCRPRLSARARRNGRKDDAGNWTDKPNFFDVKVFGNQAEMLSQHPPRAAAWASTAGSTGPPGRPRTGASAPRSRSWPSRCSSWIAAPTARAGPVHPVLRRCGRPLGLRAAGAAAADDDIPF